MTDNLRDAIAEQISEGLGAILRKFCDSPEAKQARHYLHAMPKSDWNTLIGMLAEESADVARAALAAAPQPAPDREALVRLLRIITRNGSFDDGRTIHEVIADALLARGLRLPGGEETMAWAAKVILTQPKRPGSLVADAFTSACAYLEDRECGAETTNEIIETFLKTLAAESN